MFKKKKEKDSLMTALEELIIHTDWDDMSRKKWSEDFIETFADRLNWKQLVLYNKMSMSFIRKHLDKLDLVTLAQNQELDEEFIREHAQDKQFLSEAISHQSYTVEFAREFGVEFRKQLGKDFFRRRALPNERVYQEFSNSIQWWYLSKQSKLTPHFIERYFEKFNFTANDIDEYKIDRERYYAVRKGGWAKNTLSNLTMKSGQGIVINTISNVNTYVTRANSVSDLSLWESADQ